MEARAKALTALAKKCPWDWEYEFTETVDRPMTIDEFDPSAPATDPVHRGRIVSSRVNFWGTRLVLMQCEDGRLREIEQFKLRSVSCVI